MPKNYSTLLIERLFTFTYYLSLLSPSDLSVIRRDLMQQSAKERTEITSRIASLGSEIEKTEARLRRAKRLAIDSSLPETTFVDEIRQLQSQLTHLYGVRDDCTKRLQDESFEERLRNYSLARVNDFAAQPNSIRRKYLHEILKAIVIGNRICFIAAMTNRYFIFATDCDIPSIVDSVISYGDKGEMLPTEMEKEISLCYEVESVDGFCIDPSKEGLPARYFDFSIRRGV